MNGSIIVYKLISNHPPLLSHGTPLDRYHIFQKQNFLSYKLPDKGHSSFLPTLYSFQYRAGLHGFLARSVAVSGCGRFGSRHYFYLSTTTIPIPIHNYYSCLAQRSSEAFKFCAVFIYQLIIILFTFIIIMFTAMVWSLCDFTIYFIIIMTLTQPYFQNYEKVFNFIPLMHSLRHSHVCCQLKVQAHYQQQVFYNALTKGCLHFVVAFVTLPGNV